MVVIKVLRCVVAFRAQAVLVPHTDLDHKLRIACILRNICSDYGLSIRSGSLICIPTIVMDRWQGQRLDAPCPMG